MKVVLDTSVLVASLFNRSTAKIFSLWRSGRFVICCSQSIMEEYKHILFKIPVIRSRAKKLLAEIEQSEEIIWIDKKPRIRVKIDDPADAKFVYCAVGAEAEYIVSLDDHLLSLKEYKDIKMIRPAYFLKRFK